VSVRVSAPIVARQRLGKHVPSATNTHAITEALLYASSSVRSVSYQTKVDDQFFPELLVYSHTIITERGDTLDSRNKLSKRNYLDCMHKSKETCMLHTAEMKMYLHNYLGVFYKQYTHHQVTIK
jgi:hypothetical protein